MLRVKSTEANTVTVLREGLRDGSRHQVLIFNSGILKRQSVFTGTPGIQGHWRLGRAQSNMLNSSPTMLLQKAQQICSPLAKRGDGIGQGGVPGRVASTE